MSIVLDILLFVLVFLAIVLAAGEIQARFGIESKVFESPWLWSTGFSWIPFLILLDKRADEHIKDVMLEHERVHEQQREERGFIKWSWHYIADANETMRIEAEAYAINALDRIDDGSNKEYVVGLYADKMDSDLYFFWPWLTSPGEAIAKRLLTEAINERQQQS